MNQLRWRFCFAARFGIAASCFDWIVTKLTHSVTIEEFAMASREIDIAMLSWLI